jgi:hypothetical protein
MKRYFALFMAPLVLLLSPASRAQDMLPAGTTLPVTLTTSVNSSRDQAGQRITARIMQAVSVGPGFKIPAGARVIGHIVRVERGNQRGAQLSLRFDKVLAKKHEIPLTAGLRAAASYMEIDAAQIPAMGGDAATPSYHATTVQIGGDVRYGTGGPVMEGGTKVGVGVADGVIAQVTATTQSSCAQGPSTNKPQSLWWFSSSACGTFGLPNLSIEKSGLAQPFGEITFRSSRAALKLPSGTGLLLQVIHGSYE